jgi:hypothetical protein
MEFCYYRIHFRYSLQTHSGGASTANTNNKYTQKRPICPLL